MSNARADTTPAPTLAAPPSSDWPSSSLPTSRLGRPARSAHLKAAALDAIVDRLNAVSAEVHAMRGLGEAERAQITLQLKLAASEIGTVANGLHEIEDPCDDAPASSGWPLHGAIGSLDLEPFALVSRPDGMRLS